MNTKLVKYLGDLVFRRPHVSVDDMKRLIQSLKYFSLIFGG